MKTEKDFDCLEFKRQAQARFARRYAGLSPEEICKQLNDWAEHSDDPLAKWWRGVKAQKVAEDAEKY